MYLFCYKSTNEDVLHKNIVSNAAAKRFLGYGGTAIFLMDYSDNTLAGAAAALAVMLYLEGYVLNARLQKALQHESQPDTHPNL